MKENKLKILLNELSFLCAGGLSCLIVYLLSFVSSTLNYTYILNNYLPELFEFYAEKQEFLQYVFSFISFIIFFILFRWIFKKLTINDKKTILILYYIINVLFILGFAYIFYLLISNVENKYYYTFLITKKYMFYYCLFNVYILFIFFLIYKFYDGINKKFVKVFNIIIYLIILFCIGYISYSFISDNFAYNINGLHHLDAYLSPIMKIYNGLVPSIDFNSLYGYYSYIYAFCLKIMGSPSFHNISVLLAITVALTYINISLFTSKFIKNKLLLILVLSTIVYYSLYLNYARNGGIYAQYLPGRMICPTFMLVYSLIYLKYRNTNKRKITIIIGFVLGAISLFYNFETGIIVLGSFMSLLGYELLCKYKFNDKKLYLGILKIISYALCSFILYFIIVELITYLSSGKLLSINNILYGINIFFGSGFFMLPMRLNHIWVVFAIIYAIGFSLSLSKIRIFEKDDKNYNKYAAIFFLSIFGVLVFSYYQGRSHDAVFLAVMYPGLMLLGILTEMCYENIFKKYSLFTKILSSIYSVACTTFFCLIGVSTVYLLFDNYCLELMYDKDFKNDIVFLKSKIEYMDSIHDILPNAEFLCDNGIYWNDRYGKKDTKRLNNYPDIFTYEDLYKVVNYLKEDKKDLITTYYLLDRLVFKYDKDIKDLLDSGYEIYYNKYYAIFVYSDNNKINNYKDFIKYNYGDSIDIKEEEK